MIKGDFYLSGTNYDVKQENGLVKPSRDAVLQHCCSRTCKTNLP